MNYGELKKQVLRLLNQETVAGSEVSPSYNNQQDYLNRIPGFANDALMELSTTVRKLQATVKLENVRGEDLGKETIYDLPKDFFQLISGGVLHLRNGDLEPTDDFQLLAPNKIIVPNDVREDYWVSYYRYPMLLADDPLDKDELDGDQVAQQAIPYYVASLLIAPENQYLSEKYNAKYDELRDRMQARPTADFQPVRDVYLFTGVGH